MSKRNKLVVSEMSLVRRSIGLVNAIVIFLSLTSVEAVLRADYVYAPPETGNVSSYFTANNNGGNPFRVINEWKYLDFEYLTYTARQNAIATGAFIPENNLPLGIDVIGTRIFVTTPRWKDGVPASLNTLPFPPTETSPALRPYPNWEAHGDPYNPDCSKLISVYRTSIDHCGRLWAIDSGIVNATVSLTQICPPKIVAFVLNRDEWVVSYELPPEQVKQESLHSNILVDLPLNENCNNAFVYVTDVWRFGLVVYSLAKNRSWRVTNYNFSPNPIASDFNVYGLNFQWLDGVFGMSLSLPQANGGRARVLYFHPMASYKEFAVSTDLLQDESLWPASAQNLSKFFIEIGDRGVNGQSSTSGIAENGVMFFTQVHRDNVACWDTAKPYFRKNLAMLVPQQSDTTTTSLIQFPNDLKVVKDDPSGYSQAGIWVMSNRLPIYLYSQLNYTEINFRILRADIQEAIAGTVCEPRKNSNSKITNANVLEGQCY